MGVAPLKAQLAKLGLRAGIPARGKRSNSPITPNSAYVQPRPVYVHFVQDVRGLMFKACPIFGWASRDIGVEECAAVGI